MSREPGFDMVYATYFDANQDWLIVGAIPFCLIFGILCGFYATAAARRRELAQVLRLGLAGAASLVAAPCIGWHAYHDFRGYLTEDTANWRNLTLLYRWPRTAKVIPLESISEIHLEKAGADHLRDGTPIRMFRMKVVEKGGKSFQSVTFQHDSDEERKLAKLEQYVTAGTTKDNGTITGPARGVGAGSAGKGPTQ